MISKLSNSSLVYTSDSLSINQYKNILQCYECGESNPQIQCNNCPKTFHLNCMTIHFIGQQMCQYCESRKQKKCGKCQKTLDEYDKNQFPFAQGRNKQQSNKDLIPEDNLRFCTLCFRFFHIGCAYVKKKNMKSDQQFFNVDFNFVCLSCLHNRGVANIIDLIINKERVMSLFLICGSKSPIHRTWISQYDLQQINKQRIKDGKKLIAHKKTDIQNMRIQQILGIKVPICYKNISVGELIEILKSKVQGRRCSQYGSTDNFCFLVRWCGEDQQEECNIFWQDQNVVMAFPLQICKFIVLLQYQQSKCNNQLAELLSNSIGLVHEMQMPYNVQVQIPIAFKEMSQKVVYNLRRKDIHLLKFSKSISQQLIQQLMCKSSCLIIQQILNGYQNGGPTPIIIVVHQQDIQNWRNLLCQYFSMNFVTVVDSTDSCKLNINFPTVKVPKYQILLVTYFLFNKKYIIQHSPIEFKYYLFLQNFNKTNKLCTQAIKLARRNDKIIITINSEKQYKKYILGVIKLNKQALVSYTISPILADMQPESHADEPSLSQSMQEGLSSMKPSEKDIVLRQINQQSIPSSKASSELGRTQRMIFHTYVLENGITDQIMKSSSIMDQLIRLYPSYRRSIQKYPPECYCQHLQLYVSTLKDCKDTQFEVTQDIRDFYFESHPKDILIIIIQKEKQKK